MLFKVCGHQFDNLIYQFKRPTFFKKSWLCLFVGEEVWGQEDHCSAAALSRTRQPDYQAVAEEAPELPGGDVRGVAATQRDAKERQNRDAVQLQGSGGFLETRLSELVRNFVVRTEKDRRSPWTGRRGTANQKFPGIF